MIRTRLFAFGILFCISLPGAAQEKEEALVNALIDERPAEVHMAVLDDVPADPAPEFTDEAEAMPSSGMGYYSAPNSDGQQSFSIEDRTKLSVRMKALSEAADYDRGHAVDR